jgi:hypothetical protein
MRVAIIHLSASYSKKNEISSLLSRAGMLSVDFYADSPLSRLEDCAAYVLVGDEAFEALDPLWVASLKVQNGLGKPILGIALGARYLIEAGFVPGIMHDGVGIALADAAEALPERVLLRLSEDHQYNAFTRCLSPSVVSEITDLGVLPSLIIPPGLLAEMRIQGLNLFQYCNAAGAILDVFPVNPNASVENTAAVSNKAGNVLAILPDIVGTTLGEAIFLSMRTYHEKGYVERVAPLHYLPRT